MHNRNIIYLIESSIVIHSNYMTDMHVLRTKERIYSVMANDDYLQKWKNESCMFTMLAGHNDRMGIFVGMKHLARRYCSWNSLWLWA
jgi:hypothetical protein